MAIDDLFSTPVEPAAVEPTDVEGAVKPSNDAKKAKIEAMKAAFTKEVVSDLEVANRVRKFSNMIEVSNSLGFGESGNIIVDRSKSSKDKRELATTSAIVGYCVHNIGDASIQYMTESYVQDETGKYVATRVEKTLNPGEYADLSRQYMTMFCAIPEISFQLANGKIIRGSGAKGDKGLKAELESFYFAFSKDEATGTKKQINDDEVKLNVGEKVGDKWVVKAEFVETFGWLNNPTEKAKAGRKPSGEKWTAQDIAANWIRKRIREDGDI